MGAPFINNIGAYVAAQSALQPKANAAGTRNSAGINRLALNANSGVLVAHVGAATGAPTSFTYDLKLQHSDDDGATDAYTDFVPSDGSGAIAQQTAAGLTELDVNFAGAKPYVRVVETTTITGGSSPTLPASAVLVLGGSTQLPI